MRGGSTGCAAPASADIHIPPPPDECPGGKSERATGGAKGARVFGVVHAVLDSEGRGLTWRRDTKTWRVIAARRAAAGLKQRRWPAGSAIGETASAFPGCSPNMAGHVTTRIAEAYRHGMRARERRFESVFSTGMQLPQVGYHGLCSQPSASCTRASSPPIAPGLGHSWNGNNLPCSGSIRPERKTEVAPSPGSATS